MPFRSASRILFFIALLTAPLFAQRVSSLLAPDAIYYNGKIITVDKPFRIVEAFAVKGDCFLAVGKNADIRPLAGSNTQLIDLHGHAVVPGIMDNHNHMIWRARVLHRGIDMIDVPSLAEMLSRIHQAAGKAKPGEVIVASGGWNPRAFPEKRGPMRKDLDDAAPDNPVMVFQSGRNNANLNSAALKVLGIDRNTKEWGSFPVLRDENGEPTGELSGGEQVMTADWKIAPQPSTEEEIEWLMDEQKMLQAAGLTGIREISIPVEYMRVYMQMQREEKLTMRVSMGLTFGVQHVDGENPRQMDAMLAPFPQLPGFGNPMLSFDGTLAEFEVDTQRVGNMMREPFIRHGDKKYEGENIARWPHPAEMKLLTDDQGNYYGIQRISTEHFVDVVRKMNQYGLRPGFHISGDRGLDMNLDAYEAADRDSSIKNKRWVVEHIQYSHPDQMDRLAKLKILVSTQEQAMNGPSDNFSKDLNDHEQPIREWLDHGLIVSSGSDWPAFDYHPFKYLGFYVTRIDSRGNPMGPQEKISREDALRLATINNAYMMFKEKDLGSIEADKLADFVILSDDYMTIPAEKIKNITPLATFIGGHKVFVKPGETF